MIMRPAFYQSSDVDREQARRELGFEANTAVGVVMFGGQGSSAMRRIAVSLDDRPLILMCGRNASLAQALARQSARASHQVVGHTSDVARWMRLADYFIGKPGPGSLSEALHCGLPVIVARNAWTMPQERWNTEWIRQTQVGVVLSAFSQVRTGVEAILTDLPRWRARVAQIDNRALSEVPGILQQVLAEGLLLQARTS
jgi:UDP-N-acetylglucosamine:LPS N-acetylglucosamine transferase